MGPPRGRRRRPGRATRTGPPQVTRWDGPGGKRGPGAPRGPAGGFGLVVLVAPKMAPGAGGSLALRPGQTVRSREWGGGGGAGRTHSPPPPPAPPRERYGPLPPLPAPAGIPHPARPEGEGAAPTPAPPPPPPMVRSGPRHLSSGGGGGVYAGAILFPPSTVGASALRDGGRLASLAPCLGRLPSPPQRSAAFAGSPLPTHPRAPVVGAARP